jgi:transcription antitermination factor NusG
MTDKTVLFVEGYEAENLGPITPGDAMFQPGERVTITSGDYEGEEGVVQAVGAGEGVYGGNISAATSSRRKSPPTTSACS